MQDAAPAITGDYQIPLDTLYERFDAMTAGRHRSRGVDLHGLIVARLRSNREHAAAAGWTALALERDGGSGRLRLVGAAPSAVARSIVPDWTAGVASAS